MHASPSVFVPPVRVPCTVCGEPLTETGLGPFCSRGHSQKSEPLRQPIVLTGTPVAREEATPDEVDAIVASLAPKEEAPPAAVASTIPAPAESEPAKPRTTRSRRSKETPVSESLPIAAPTPLVVKTNGVHALSTSDAAEPAPVPPTLALSMKPEAVAEVRAAFGINPGRMKPSHMNALLQAAVKEGVISPLANGADVLESFYALGNVVPAGWFKAHADDAKTGVADAEITDPALLVSVDGKGDPDAPPAKPAPIEAKAFDVSDDVYEKLAKCTRPIVAVALLQENLGIKTWPDLIGAARFVQAKCPAFERAADLEEKVRRTLDVQGITLPGM